MLIRNTKTLIRPDQIAALCAGCTIKRFPAGSYAIEIADINHFFNQCKGMSEGHLTKSFHEAGVQVICVELNTYKGILLLQQSKESNFATGKPLGSLHCSSLNSLHSLTPQGAVKALSL